MARIRRPTSRTCTRSGAGRPEHRDDPREHHPSEIAAAGPNSYTFSRHGQPEGQHQRRQACGRHVPLFSSTTKRPFPRDTARRTRHAHHRTARRRSSHAGRRRRTTSGLARPRTTFARREGILSLAALGRRSRASRTTRSSATSARSSTWCTIHGHRRHQQREEISWPARSATRWRPVAVAELRHEERTIGM